MHWLDIFRALIFSTSETFIFPHNYNDFKKIFPGKSTVNLIFTLPLKWAQTPIIKVIMNSVSFSSKGDSLCQWFPTEEYRYMLFLSGSSPEDFKMSIWELHLVAFLLQEPSHSDTPLGWKPLFWRSIYLLCSVYPRW